MRTRIASTIVAVIAMAAATLASGVVKTQGVVEGTNVRIFAGSKTTGKGGMVTLCNYQEADTGHYLGQTQTFEVAFDNEVDLFLYCASTMPAF